MNQNRRSARIEQAERVSDNPSKMASPRLADRQAQYSPLLTIDHAVPGGGRFGRKGLCPMMTAAGLLDRLYRKAFVDRPRIDGGWIRITEAIVGTNWSMTTSATVPESISTLLGAERDRLEISAPRIDWSEVTSHRGLVRELVRYLD